VWREKARAAAPRVLTAAAALVLTATTFIYTPIASQGTGTGIRIWLLLAVMAISAVSTWMLLVGRRDLPIRLLINLSCGFNLVWIFSAVGPPVVVASVVAAGLATIPAPRSLLPALIGVAVAGLCLGLIVLRFS
jgi:hypothetical protein